MRHGRTQCVYRTSYECSYVKTVAALCGVDWSLQNRRRRWWVRCNKAGALLSTWVLFANLCCLPDARFTLKGSNPVHPWEQHLWYVPLPGLGRIQQSLYIYSLRPRKKVLLYKYYLLFPSLIERNPTKMSAADSFVNNHLLEHLTPCDTKHNTQDNSILLVCSPYQYITRNADNCLMKLRWLAACMSHISSNSATIPVK
jgi:hypothetical protein